MVRAKRWMRSFALAFISRRPLVWVHSEGPEAVQERSSTQCGRPAETFSRGAIGNLHMHVLDHSHSSVLLTLRSVSEQPIALPRTVAPPAVGAALTYIAKAASIATGAEGGCLG